MLVINVPESERWDEIKEEFVYVKACSLLLEHSLVSLQKWEAKWNVPFIDTNDKTEEQQLDYIRFMTMTKNVDPQVYYSLSAKNYSEINAYINAPMTATWFSGNNKKKKSSSRKVTAELIYYWMIAYGIPFECRKWHLNQLLTLIEVCEEEGKEHQKKSRKQTLAEHSAINKARRNKYKKR